MADYPHMPFFVDAYLGDTMHLSLEEHGAYLKLLMIAWRSPDCALPDDDRKLARMLGVTVAAWTRRLRPAIAPFWTVADGVWTQKKQRKIREKVSEISQLRASAAAQRWNGDASRNSPAKPPSPNESGPANGPARDDARGVQAPSKRNATRADANPNPNPNPKREPPYPPQAGGARAPDGFAGRRPRRPYRISPAEEAAIANAHLIAKGYN
jgi:uncharacterized protein YdaU (DUF1376 family)